MVTDQYVGVDRDSDGWVTVALDGEGGSTVDVFDEFQTLWETYEQAERIVVDIPIGFCEPIDADGSSEGCIVEEGEATRECDKLARMNVGRRSSSVFNAPARVAARKSAKGDNGDGEPTYQDISNCNESAVGKGLTQQSANIASDIWEVEELLDEGADEETIVEGHPEVCFRAFKGETLEHSKHSAAGVDERLQALENVDEFENISWRALAADLGEEEYSAGLDDLLDALVLALTASAGEDEYETLPECPPEDSEGRPVQMVYRSDEQLPETTILDE